MDEQLRNHVLVGRLLGVFHKVRLAEAIRKVSSIEFHTGGPKLVKQVESILFLVGKQWQAHANASMLMAIGRYKPALDDDELRQLLSHIQVEMKWGRTTISSGPLTGHRIRPCISIFRSLFKNFSFDFCFFSVSFGMEGS